MARDHYVAQTYLGNFTNDRNRLFPYYKKARIVSGKSVSPRSVCYTENGSSTKYLENPRALEEFLKPIEKAWNKNLSKISAKACTPEIRMDIAAYLACLRMCTPVHIRKGQAQFASILSSTAKVLAEQGQFDFEHYTAEFNAKMKAGIMNDEVEFSVNPEYALAESVQSVPSIIRMLCNADWKILFDESNNFLTSDNPLCLYYPDNNPQYAWWYAPLTPSMAAIIRPNINLDLKAVATDPKLPWGNMEYGIIKPIFRDQFNENLVRCAEQAVYFSSKQKWVEDLVEKNKKWRTEMVIDVLPTLNGYLNIGRDRARERKV